MIYTRPYVTATNRFGFILSYETQVLCDRCHFIIIDWTRNKVISYSALPIPVFDYVTGSIQIFDHECLCKECLPKRVEDLKGQGITYQHEEDRIMISMRVPEDYIPLQRSLWHRFKDWWNKRG